MNHGITKCRSSMMITGIKLLCCIAFLLACTWLVYYPSLSYPFEFDDFSSIVKYFKIRYATLGQLFFANSRWISYWLNGIYFALSPEGNKFDPWWYRVGSITLHSVAGTAVFYMMYLIARLGRYPVITQLGLLVPLLTAGLFLLHPVQTQTVSYVVQGQLEGLAGCFCFILSSALLTYSIVERSWMRWLLATSMVISALLASGSKEIILIVPFLLLIIDWFFIAHGSLTNLKSRLWLHLLIASVLWVGCIYLLKPHYFISILSGSMELPNNVGNILTETRSQKITAGRFFISQFKVILHYIGIFFAPWTMSADYDWKLSQHAMAPDSIIPLLILSLFALYIVRRLSVNPTDLISFCCLWFFIAILPRSSIVPSTELMADYKTYIGSFGIYLLQAMAIASLLLWLRNRSWWRGGMITIYLIASVLLALCAFMAYRRDLVWSSPAAFWADVIKHAPQRARAYNNYGVALCEAGNHNDAIRNFLYAVALDDSYADPYNNLSVAYCALKRFDDAIAVLRKSIAIMPFQPEAYNNLASVLMSVNRDADVEKILKHAIALRPHYGKAYFNLGKLYFKLRRDDDAYEAFKAACTRADFDNEIGFTTYGNICLMKRYFEEAIAAYTSVLACNPRATEIALKRIYAAEQLQRYDTVDTWFKELLACNSQSSYLYIQYGDILVKRSDYKGAVNCYNKAISLQPTPAAWYKLAQAASQGGDYTTARHALEQLDPKVLPREIGSQVERLKARLP